MFEVVMKGGLDNLNGPTGTLLKKYNAFLQLIIVLNNEMSYSSDLIGKALGYFSWEKKHISLKHW